jgi:peptidoglycan/xylan/chitin deacetylase (PgdA/CDA1 family)
MNSSTVDSVTVLTYHALAAEPGDLAAWEPDARHYVLTRDEFNRHLDHLASEGFTTIGLDDFVTWHAGDADLPERPIILTFDDGHASNVSLALPALAGRGMRAAFFLTVGRIGQEGTLGWDGVAALLDAGMTIGSHTLTHRMPSTLSAAELERELVESKRLLEERFGRAVDFVASPTGYDSRHFARAARQAGYRAALQGAIGRNGRGVNLFALRRLVLKRSHDFDLFRRLCDPADHTYRSLRRRQALRNLVRRIIGPRGYEGIRRRVLKGQDSHTD